MITDLYCRISRDQTGEGMGVARQLEDCRALAESLGWTVRKVHTDNDFSATSGKVRPGYRDMLRAVEAGEVEAIIAWHPDRLYRRLADLEELIVAVEARNVAIRTCRYGDFDLGTPTGRMVARILASVATGEVEVKSDRYKRSIRQRREAGQPPRSRVRCFGYTHDWEIVPAEAALVRSMANRLLEGVTLWQLAADLNSQGIPTTPGNAWQTTAVKQLLRNPRLAGHSTHNGAIVGAGTWEPILEQDVWERVVALLDSRRKVAGSSPRVSLLPGLLHCGKCGSKMVTSMRRVRDEDGVLGRRRDYRCQSTVDTDNCGGVSGVAAGIDRVVEGFARRRLSDPRVLARLAEVKASAGGTGAAVEAVDLEQRITDLERQLAEPGVPVEALLAAIRSARARQAEVREQLAAAALVDVDVPEARAEWPEDLRRRRRLVELVVERVELAPAPTGPRSPRSKIGFDPARVSIKPRF